MLQLHGLPFGAFEAFAHDQSAMSLRRIGSLEGRLFDHPFASFEKRTLVCGCIERTFHIGAQEKQAVPRITKHCVTHSRPGEYCGPEPYERKHDAETGDDELAQRVAAMISLPESSREGLLEMVRRAPNGTFTREQRPCKCIKNRAIVWIGDEVTTKQRYGMGAIEPCREHFKGTASSL